MKRFHVHAHVTDLKAAIAFYSKLFATEPTRTEPDYAKWMLEDPRLNFAISTRGGKPGIDHLGIQTDSVSELEELQEQARSADLALFDEGETTCCYARSDKHWVTDPDGVAWEHFHTLANIPVFHEAPEVTRAKKVSSVSTPAPGAVQEESASCCSPRAASGRPLASPITVSITPAKSCC
jgi:catechol 2,3-dioxygenase-like lactoylglutathione lyase family enzyme